MNRADQPARLFDQALAERLVRYWQDAPAVARAWVKELSQALGDGHSCLYLGDRPAEDVASLRAWCAVATEGVPEDRPLVLDAGHRLYLRRYWRYECEVAARFAALARRVSPWPAAAIEQALVQCVDPFDAEPEQRAAVATALRGGLSVILGGPGTGKTWTVMRLLAALRALPGGDRLRVAMAAATGKAAQRMNEVLARELPDAAAAIKATTVHGLIGLRRNSLVARYRAGAPLPADVVLVDEAAMLDLPTMSRLLAALSPDARLVLLGDPDQLASVEAGAVLAELRELARRHSDHPVARAVISLRRARRFQGDGVLPAAIDAIRVGDADALIALLRGAPATLDWRADPPARPAPAIAQGEVIRAMDAGGDVTQRLAAIASARVLAALREGPFGVVTLNNAVRRDRGKIDGEPVLVTANARAQGLANGDVGVMIDADGERRAIFDRGPAGLQTFTPHELPAHEAAWAMTVHKAQGSEFDTVLVLLPEPAHPLVTREWLYTAVSRARERVLLWATPDALRAALAQPAARVSGLGARLIERA